MSHINVASTKALLKDYFGNIDAGNWSAAKEQLEMALNSAGHLIPLQKSTDPPAMLTVTAFTKANVIDEAGWYHHQQTHAESKAKHEAVVKNAKAHLMMCVGQPTYDTVKHLPAHEQWAKLESVFAATSSTVDRSARLVDLVTMPQFVVADDFEAWLATFKATVTAINHAAYAPTVNALGDDADIGKLEQSLRRSALSDRTRREQAQALVTRLRPPPASSEPLTNRLSQRRAGPPSRGPPAKRTGNTGPYLDARLLPNIAQWPPGVTKKGRLALYPTQCYSCYKEGHFASACPVPEHMRIKAKAESLKEYGVSVTFEQAKALVHNTMTQDEYEKALALLAKEARECEEEDEIIDASSYHVRISEEITEQCFSTTTATPFLLDSGATRHMTTRLDLLHDFQPSPAGRRVRVTGAFGSGGFASGTGSLRFSTNGKDMALSDVLHVPGLEAELVSLHCLIEDGYDIRVAPAPEARGLIVSRDNVDAHFKLRNKQFVLEASPCAPSPLRDSALNVALLPSADLPLWHGRLGHGGVNAVLASGRAGSIGLDTAAVTPDSIQTVKDCVPCHLGKHVAHRSHAAATHRATAPFGRVFMDLWGPGPVVSLSGHRYLCGGTDEYSRYRWLRGLTAKSDATRAIQDLVAFSSVQYPDSSFRTLVTDRGGEFVNKQLDGWLASRGIVHDLSAPYEHGQMGLQERSWRTIFDKVRTSLAQSGLPLFLWEEAAHAAVYALNLTATSTLGNSTPDLVLHASGDPVAEHRRPRGSRLRVWGYRALVPLLPEQRLHKLAPRSRHCFFVGYSQTSKAWRFYDPDRRKVFESSQATFFEREFGRKHTAKETSTLRRWSGSMDHDGDAPSTAPLNQDDEVDDDHAIPEDSAAAPVRPPTPVAVPPAPAANAAPPPPAGLAFNNPGPAWSTPTGDRSSRTRAPPVRLGGLGEFAMAATAVTEFGADEAHAVKIIDFEWVFTARPNPDAPTYWEAMSSEERGMWLLAIETEKAALAAKGTFSPALHLPPGTPIIKSKWVLAIKRDSEGRIEKYKARLVARGDMQKAGRDYKETFSPTGRAASHRLLLGLAIENEWETRQFDVSSAYLNGEMGDVVVHMELPDKSVVRLRKTLYGLCQAGREWYKVFAGWIESIGFVRTESDHAVFVKIEGAHKLFLSIHVDDGLLTGDGDLDGFITQLKSRFEAKSSDEATFFLGQRIVREGKTGAAIVHQPHFISSILEDHDMAGCSSRPTPMCLYKSRTPNYVPFDASTKPYRTIVASHCNNFSQVDWEALMHILRYLQGTRNVGLLFRRSDAPGAPLLRGFVDADHGADPETRRSVTGFVFLCAGGAVSWMSKRQALVTVSSTEAEYVAMSFAAREGIWLRRLLSELGFAQSEPTRLHGDNQSAIQLAKHPAFHARTKHIGIHFHFIRDHIAEGTIEMVWIPTNTMAADVLTKGLGSRKHWDFVHAMGLVDASREGASWKERQAVEEVCAAYARAQECLNRI
ncbi:BQ2448_5393 [Microbotryum intermedium]|uniref:BQ2448_5393 protein n=1 Tax=Microbotryum intermedium TaxID=269621 RepID=A0A238F0V2_9BASI|nr:BQ2448_5393 [Microbotryum intermedium]